MHSLCLRNSLATGCAASYSCTHSVYAILSNVAERIEAEGIRIYATKNITPAQIYRIFGCFIFLFKPNDWKLFLLLSALRSCNDVYLSRYVIKLHPFTILQFDAFLKTFIEERDDLGEFGNEFSCKRHRTDFFSTLKCLTKTKTNCDLKNRWSGKQQN